MTYRDPRGRHCTVCKLLEEHPYLKPILARSGPLAAKVRHLNAFSYPVSYKAVWRHVTGQHSEARQIAKQKLAWRMQQARLKRSTVFRVLKDYGLEAILQNPSRISSSVVLKLAQIENEEKYGLRLQEARLDQL